MIQANLLPWREVMLRQRALRWLRLGIVMLSMVIVISLAGREWLSGNIRQQQVWLTQQQQVISATERLISQQQQRYQELSQLREQQQQRERRVARLKQWANVWQQLPGWLPDAVWLTSVSRQGTQVIFRGESHSVLPLQAFIQQLQRQPFFRGAELRTLTLSEEGSYRFTLQAGISSLLSEVLGGGDA